jgi:hypothetical protein
VTALALVAVMLAACSPSLPDRPDAHQKDAWKSAAWHAIPRALRVGVKGPGNDGNVWFVSMSIDLREKDLTPEDVDAVVEAIQGATEPGNEDLEVRVSFFSRDPTNASQLGVMHLDEVLGDDPRLGGSGTLLIVPAGA